MFLKFLWYVITYRHVYKVFGDLWRAVYGQPTLLNLGDRKSQGVKLLTPLNNKNATK